MNVEGSFQAAFSTKYVGMHPVDLASIRREIARDAFKKSHKAFVILAAYAEKLSTDESALQDETMKARMEAIEAGKVCANAAKTLKKADAKLAEYKNYR